MTATELAAVLAGVILLASMASVELGVSVALLELGSGVVAGNLIRTRRGSRSSRRSRPSC
jgi:hypothetical protein